MVLPPRHFCGLHGGHNVIPELMLLLSVFVEFRCGSLYLAVLGLGPEFLLQSLALACKTANDTKILLQT